MFVIDWIIALWDWLWDHSSAKGTMLVMFALLGLAMAWRISLAVFPYKRCPRCKGAGSYGPGNLRRPCGRCNGGRLPRVGSGR